MIKKSRSGAGALCGLGEVGLCRVYIPSRLCVCEEEERYESM